MEYTHGGDIYSLNTPVLDFSANQNPLGMPPAVAEAARAAVAEADRYPDSRCTALRRAISALDGVPEEYITCGNGAADLLFRLCGALKPQWAVVAAPTFSEYEQAVTAAGGRVFRCPLEPEAEFRLDAFYVAALAGADLAFLCSPNNPTGRLVDSGVLDVILRYCRNARITLVVDECFLKLSDQPGPGLAPQLADYPNLVLLRAFTKSYGMPGLRLGYCLTSNTDLTEAIARAGQPWSVSNVAQAAGVAACGCPDWPEKAMAEVVRPQRARLTAELRSLGLTVWESQANYILFRAPGRADLKERLVERGVLIRSCANYHGLKADFYRIAVRPAAENDVLLRELREVL